MSLLFHSKFCEHSIMLLNIIDKAGIKITKISVDINPKTKRRNPVMKKYRITEVPTLIYDNQKFCGDKAFQAIEQLISSSNKKSEPEKTQKSEIQHYSSEFDGFSDNFSAFGEEKPSPLQRSFTFLGNDSPIITNKSDIDECSKKEVASNYEKMIQERNSLN